MKVACVTFTDAMSGAGIAALRTHRARLSIGADSSFHVLRKRSDADDVVAIGTEWTRRFQTARNKAARGILRALGSPANLTLSGNFFPTGLHRHLSSISADVLHLHWIGEEMIRIEELCKIDRPVVWTLHDEWFSEGFEHYSPSPSFDQMRPRIIRSLLGLVDMKVRQRKARAWTQLAPTLVAPSKWLADRATASGLASMERIHVVPNPVPLHVFHPQDRSAARIALGLDPAQKIIGFGAVQADTDPRKGFALLEMALQRLRWEGKVTLLVFGADKGDKQLPLSAHFSGRITSDSQMANLYAAMDVFVCPSIQENFPNTIGEAMACGVPCVAYAVGGIPEMIRSGLNGILATPGDADSLASGIATCLNADSILGLEARRFAEEVLDPRICASRYASVYDEALRSQRPSLHT